MTLYHGTAADFREPRTPLFLTNQPSIALAYGGDDENARVLTIEASFRRSLVVGKPEDLRPFKPAAVDPNADTWAQLDEPATLKRIREAGYDSVHLLHDREPIIGAVHDTWVALTKASITVIEVARPLAEPGQATAEHREPGSR